ncbi:PLDc_N domain-containing protein [Cryobacterium sp. TMT1-19]|uniref:PLD nuclease N-terminal domain-containing protein n=1 Tax=unclassified Cryobacterium TaxID=2649013 RepID=UPI000CE2F7F7|nr:MULTISPECIES: PLD nuclease N-terminal domain-containing protein [unclassified Cryobacterium]TFD35096.1 PLDc_N domain-containing protein [Cryobacterium sp. TMT1-19]
MDNPAALAIALASVVAVLYGAAIAYAIVQIARTRDLSEVEKVLWMIAVVFAPLLGALVWYFAGPHPFGLRLTRQVR